MIVVAVRVRVKPAKRDEFLKLAQGMLDPSRAEKGCITYNVHVDAFDPNAFLYLEEWESHEALKVHLKTDHYTSYSQGLAELLERPSEVRVYSVSKVELR